MASCGWHRGAMQEPPQYEVVPVQTVPHAPQLCGSLPVFTHAPLQQASPNPHAGLQVPAPLDVEPPLPPLLPEELPPLAEEPPLVPEEFPLLPDPELLPLEG